MAKLILSGQGGGTTQTVPIADNLTSGKLENPAPDDTARTTLITPDQRGQHKSVHTGNVNDTPAAIGNTTVIPIHDTFNKVDSIYVSENQENRDNLGNFIGQSGAPINVLPGSNAPVTINDREYSAHAIDRMQGRGIPPSAYR